MKWSGEILVAYDSTVKFQVEPHLGGPIMGCIRTTRPTITVTITSLCVVHDSL